MKHFLDFENTAGSDKNSYLHLKQESPADGPGGINVPVVTGGKLVRPWVDEKPGKIGCDII